MNKNLMNRFFKQPDNLDLSGVGIWIDPIGWFIHFIYQTTIYL